MPEDLYHLKGGLSQEKFPEKSEVHYESIKLKAIISYAEQKKASIVEGKIREIISSGKDIKSILEQEGLSVNEYQMFMRNIKAITGKGILDYRKVNNKS